MSGGAVATGPSAMEPRARAQRLVEVVEIVWSALGREENVSGIGSVFASFVAMFPLLHTLLK